MPARLILVLLLALSTPVSAGGISKRSLVFGGRERTYYLDAPAADRGPAPLLLLLHGSGGNGLFLAQLWQETAAREGIVLLAPDSARTELGWDLHADGPDDIHALIAAVAADHPVDRRRLYLFGQSGGAVYALTLGLLESEYFAAVAVHAGGWRSPAEHRVLAYAKRRIPISIAVGDRDEYFPMRSIRATEAALEEAGFPVTLDILDGRRHSLLDVPAGFNDKVWAFLSAHASTVRRASRPTARRP